MVAKTKFQLGASTLFAWKDGKSPKLFEEIVHRRDLLWEIVDEDELAVTEDDALKLRTIGIDHQVSFSVHVPFLRKDILSSNFVLRSSSIASIKRSLEMANKYEARFAIIHPGYRNDGISLEEAAEILNDLFDYSHELGITPLLENLTKGAAFYRPEDIKLFQKLLFRPNFALDVGHANIEDNLEGFLRTNRAFSYFHIHDNLGHRDEHLPLGRGSINWGAFFSEVMRSDPSRPLVIENFSLHDLEISLDFALKMLS